MKHKKGIELGVGASGTVYFGPVMDPEHTVIGEVASDRALGGHCAACERTGWIDRELAAKRFSANAYLSSLAPRLRCMKCGNTRGNRWILGKIISG